MGTPNTKNPLKGPKKDPAKPGLIYDDYPLTTQMKHNIQCPLRSALEHENASPA
jgi:hypothetical protein